jgi:hypothetical protein
VGLLDSWTGHLVFGQIIAFGIEGAGSYGGALMTYVLRQGFRVIGVSQPDRRLSRLNGRSDTRDAENAARAVLAGFTIAIPKTANGTVEMIRQLKVAHDTAVKGRAATMVTLKAMLIHAQKHILWESTRMTQIKLARHLAALGPSLVVTPDDSIRHALGALAKRWQTLHPSERTINHDRRAGHACCPALGGAVWDRC